MEREIIGNIGGLYMCGYVSIYYKNNNRKFDIKKLAEKINHRGPDHTGIHKEDNIEFAFKRLSIMDLENGSQPLKKDDKTIVFNGEIYNHVELRNELKDKGYTLVDDSNYTNMNSRIIIRCEKGHLVETCLQDFRKTSFTCPICDSNVNFINPREIPKKNGYRIIAFDQATEKFGISIFENNKLIFYSLMSFSGPLILRLTKIRKFVKDTIIKN